MICDFCGKKLSDTAQNLKAYHMLENYVHKPIVCKDCYRRIKKMNDQQITKSQPPV